MKNTGIGILSESQSEAMEQKEDDSELCICFQDHLRHGQNIPLDNMSALQNLPNHFIGLGFFFHRH